MINTLYPSIFILPHGLVEHANGDKEWFINGQLHQEDGPAVEYVDGYKAWWIHGKRHRTDGPAIEYPNGDKLWYLHGKEYGKNNDFNNESWIHFQKSLLF